MTQWSMMSNMTDEELLNEMHVRRNQSVVINELCKRLEKHVEDKVVTGKETTHHVECPVCMANLFVDYNNEDDRFDIEYRQP